MIKNVVVLAAYAALASQPHHSVTALQTELATLGYLPLTSRLEWRYKEPTSLTSLWKRGSYNVITKGAVMEFQAVNHLPIDGIAGPKTWSAIEQAYQHRRMNPYGYTYVSVSEARPETINIWHNGKLVLSSLVNTGITQSPTVMGTFPVYLRYSSQEMKGRNPDGSYYDDRGVPYVNYFYKGEAIHGFWRKFYGSPQSLGCVELPIAKAKIAWEYINFGTLVTIQHNPTSNPSVSPYNYPTIRKGEPGTSYVKKLQHALGIGQEGYFGPKTEAAVRQFQKAHGLVVDGIVGPQTWKALLSK